ncbi:GDYXXLXY domain-containing protein [Bacillus sp. AK031]
MNGKLINLGYLFGISLLLASIFYFFASNWQGFDRLSKVGLSAGILIVFYFLCLLLAKYLQGRLFLSRWVLVCTGVSFGISVALIGQIYNSHADSYLLFAVWLIPMVFLSLVTRYKPFYLLSFILLQFTFYFFLYPSSYFIRWTETQLLLLILFILAVNACIFLICVKSKVNIPVIKYSSFVITQWLFIYLSFSENFPVYGLWMNVLFLANIFLGLFFYLKISPQKGLAAGFIASLAVYLVSKGFELMIHYLGEGLFVFLLLFSITLVVLSIRSVRHLEKIVKNNLVFQKSITVSVIFIATIFSVISIIGLITLSFMDFSPIFLFYFSLVMLILPGLVIPLKMSMPDTLKYTILCTGYTIALGSSLFSEYSIEKIILLLVSLVGIVLMKTSSIRVIQFIVSNAALFTLLAEFFEAYHWIALIMLLFNSVIYFLQGKGETGIRKSAFFAALVFFISLTIADQSPMALFLTFNVLYFTLVTALVVIAKRRELSYEFYVSLLYWFVFIGYKYYDLMWQLVHKSILFFVLSILFLSITLYFDSNKRETEADQNLVGQKWKAIVIVALMQIGFLGYQTFTNEKLLSEGTAVKLELAPVDPRSLLQGDYVTLNYEISQPDSFLDIGRPGEKVQLILRPDGDTHTYSGIYKIRGKWNKEYIMQNGDVAINGVISGDGRVIYGIETFFVQEGTGTEIESSAEYAIVKVAASGNALLVELQ